MQPRVVEENVTVLLIFKFVSFADDIESIFRINLFLIIVVEIQYQV